VITIPPNGLIVDGGLATELENLGQRLDHRLWSARILETDPDAIYQAHWNYLVAGAQCIITSTYQLSYQGCAELGYSHEYSQKLMLKSVNIAKQAVDDFVMQYQPTQRPWVAASVGPYAAYLADGSEYTGTYSVNELQLQEFHDERFHTLAKSSADLLACETIPTLAEASALKSIVANHKDIQVWVSFCCRDGRSLADGSLLSEAVGMFQALENVLAVGINCTAPEFIDSLLRECQRGAPNKDYVVYPNSGECYDHHSHSWLGIDNPQHLHKMAPQWRKMGAKLVGGCCRSTPAEIRLIAEALWSD
jgi:homocysteine S-methyltransferase